MVGALWTLHLKNLLFIFAVQLLQWGICLVWALCQRYKKKLPQSLLYFIGGMQQGGRRSRPPTKPNIRCARHHGRKRNQVDQHVEPQIKHHKICTPVLLLWKPTWTIRWRKRRKTNYQIYHEASINREQQAWNQEEMKWRFSTISES